MSEGKIEFAFDRRGLVMLACAAGLTGLSLLALGVLVGFEIQSGRGTGQSPQAAVQAVPALKAVSHPTPQVDSAPAVAQSEEPAKKSLVNVVDVASFRDRANAERLARELDGQGYPVRIVDRTDSHKHGWLVVRVGPYEDRKDASDVALKLMHFRGATPVVRVLGN